MPICNDAEHGHPNHEPGIIHTWTFDQSDIWIDKRGRDGNDR